MLDDRSDHLFGGFWPFLKRFLFLVVPIWVFLLLWAAKVPTVLAALMGGASMGCVLLLERWALMRENEGRKD